MLSKCFLGVLGIVAFFILGGWFVAFVWKVSKSMIVRGVACGALLLILSGVFASIHIEGQKKGRQGVMEYFAGIYETIVTSIKKNF